MRLTREGTGVVVLLAAMAVLSVLLDRLTLLFGVAVIGAWFLIYQWSVVKAFITANDGLSVELTPHQSRQLVNEDVTITLQLTKPTDTAVSLTAIAPSPIGASSSSREDRLVIVSEDEATAATTFSHQYPVAGQHVLPPIELTFSDRLGLFSEKRHFETNTQIQITPRAPRSMHVGQAGERVTAAYGDTPSGQRGGGLLPLVLREYTADDSAGQIDWNATARLGTPYVTEYEQESDYETIFVIDHRASMAVGPPGETKFDYARDLALSFIEAGFNSTDTVGLSIVESDSYRWIRKPAAGGDFLRLLGEELRRLSNPQTSASQSRRKDGGSRFREESQLLRQRLSTETSPFETTLRSYLRPARNTVQVREDSLQEALTELHTRRGRSNTGEVLLFTDDTNRHRLLDSVSQLRRHGYTIGVFLTPSVLFETQDLTALESAYDRYVSFEEFRKRLTRLEGVSAFEVGPRERLTTLLSASQPPESTSRQD
ncbi:DUF58 domain-containing protein [Haloprofundus salilacus]|uniref:DUF58 domain-containing protein n=1 Tax=Haloprofundus salilacus TaxID=2876190 RepID=UPI001CCEB2C2|nr:DUF58 domain-containing protein [Haloprofundus salilacus]